MHWRFGVRKFKEPRLSRNFRITEEYGCFGYTTIGYVGFHEKFSDKEMAMIFEDLAKQIKKQKKWKKI